MKKFLLIGILSLAILAAQAQLLRSGTGNQGFNGKFTDQITINDFNGTPIKNKYPDVNGSPYFNPDFKVADIVLTGGRVFNKVPMKIDLVAQELLFLSANNQEAIMSAGMVKEVTYNDTLPNAISTIKLATGFPPIDKQSDQNFYQVLSEGKCSLIKSLSKKVLERKSELSGEIYKEFELYENLYLFTDGVMSRFKRDKEAILSVMQDKRAEMEKFLIKNSGNLKNQTYLVSIFNYYNNK